MPKPSVQVANYDENEGKLAQACHLYPMHPEGPCSSMVDMPSSVRNPLSSK